MKGRHVSVAKDGIPKLKEESTLKKLGKQISMHGFCWTMMKGDVVHF